MTTDEQLGASRRTPRQGVGGSPVGSGLTIVLAVVALVAGFFILSDLTDDGGSSASDPSIGVVDDPGLTIPEVSVTAAPVATEPPDTTPIRTTTGATVVVANANTVGGSAGQMSSTLEFEGYTMGPPTNATGPNLDESIVYYDTAVAGALPVAESVARDLGGVEVLTLVSPAPVTDGDLGGAGVLLLLGDAQAGQTIAELSAGTTGAGATPEAPEPSDGDTVDTGE
ncbi:MAG: LytR C-terminal domain-containing protein [Ilumatobacter sp.]